MDSKNKCERKVKKGRAAGKFKLMVNQWNL